jgi:hypothetical protein
MATSNQPDAQEELSWRRILTRTGKPWWRSLLQVPFTLFFMMMAVRLLQDGPTGLRLAIVWFCFMLFTVTTIVNIVSAVFTFQAQRKGTTD